MRGLLQRLAALGPDAIALRIERSLMAATAVSVAAAMCLHNASATEQSIHTERTYLYIA
jgi:hypothetical protein